MAGEMEMVGAVNRPGVVGVGVVNTLVGEGEKTPVAEVEVAIVRYKLVVEGEEKTLEEEVEVKIVVGVKELELAQEGRVVEVKAKKEQMVYI